MPDSALESADDLLRSVEACLFAAEEPLTREQISAHLGDADVKEALASLQEQYSKRGINLVERGKRWQFQTAPDLAHILRREKDHLRRLSRAATEVLAIIAYHEPVSRAEIEAIRGVQTSGGTLDVLMEAGWARVAGRREVPGRPVIYATTPEFLTHFGLESRKDLPGLAELKASGLLDPVDDAYEDLMEQKTAQAEQSDTDGENEPTPDDQDVPEGEAASQTLEKPDESA
jgi:segregation and condensation protein B